jgi:hypothetical protein
MVVFFLKAAQMYKNMGMLEEKIGLFGPVK